MKPVTAVIMATLALASPALAAISQPAATFSAGGGETASASYINLGVLGQPGIVGSSGSANYGANHGFLSVLGDGFKILYPVIAVNKNSISFTLAASSSGSDTLAISNTGGSVLKWSIAKSGGSSWLTATPDTGSGALTVNISADTTGLSAGSTYNDTLIISGSGIQQTAAVQLSLTVTSATTFRLTVTPVSNTMGKGGGNINSNTGQISCSNTGNNPATATGTCWVDLAYGSSITLLQTPDSNSTLATWSGACAGTGNCQVTNIAANTSVTATFPYSSMAKINLGNGYESLALAYGGAEPTDTIKARAVTFPLEDLLLNSGKIITLLGGLDAYYAAQVGQYSTLSGKLTIGTGSLTVDKLIIK